VPTVQLTPTTLTIRLTRAEKIGGLLRDLEVPLTAVRDARVVESPLAALRGLRAPGLALPGVRKIGTWRRAGGRTYVSVRRDQPALLIDLSGQHYDQVLVSVEDAPRLAAALSRAS
jgi:hypothetical protein